MGTNFGSLVSGGAFEGKNSYWGQEYNIAQAVAGVSIIGSTTPSACSWSRGDMGGHVLAGTACNVTTDQSNGAGDMTYAPQTEAPQQMPACQVQSREQTGLNAFWLRLLTQRATVMSAQNILQAVLPGHQATS
jgi:hypothetical protein